MSTARNRDVIVVSVLLALAGAYALKEVLALRWVTDDAFISFRYAQNLCRGLGLVFNAGERVEGYTNFLWTLLVAVGMRLGVDPVTWTAGLGIAAYFASICTLVALSWKLHARNPSRPFLPLAALGLLLQHDQHVYATGGLETSWVMLLLTLPFAVLLLADRPRDYALAGGFLTVAALCRPDALLFLVSAMVFTLILPGARVRNTALLLVSPILVYIPYWLWRYHYYGFLFPNTYYAKSAGLAYYGQGVTYVWLYLKSYYVLGLVPLAVLWLFAGIRSPLGKALLRIEARTAVLLAAFLVPYGLYVVRVGGDFMFGRFLLPVTGLGFFALESALIHSSIRRGWSYVLGAVLAILVLARQDVYAGSPIVDGVADEPACYPREWLSQAQAAGQALRSLFAGKDVRVAFVGRYAMWAYYTDPAVAIEAETGLTDTTIAHRPLQTRGRPGHEKPASAEYLQKRRVNFLYRPPVESAHPFDRLRVARLGSLETLMLTYDRDLMEALSQSAVVSFTDFPRYLDSVMAASETMSRGKAGELLAFSRPFYFDHNEDPERLRQLQALVGGGGSPPGESVASSRRALK